MNKLKKYVAVLLMFFSITTFSKDYSQADRVFTANLNAYEGVWEYSDSNQVFRVIIKKVPESTRFVIGESLIGDYFYQRDGVILDNYVEKKIPSEINDANNRQIIVYASNGVLNPNNINPNRLYMLFRDKRYNKVTGSGEIILLSPTQIHWKLENDEGPVDMDFIHEFSIPTDVILTKVK